MKNITLVIPAKNEKESLPQVLEELEKFDYKIMVVLHKSDIETIESIKNYDVKIAFQKDFGYGDALITGIKETTTELFCIFNADGSFDAQDLNKMYVLIQNNDFIFTTRYEKPGGSEDDTITTLIGNKIFSKIGNIFFSLKISDILYTFIMGKTQSFKDLHIKSNDFRFCVELPIKMQIRNMKYKSIPSYELKRIAGKKKVNAFKDGFLIMCEILKLFFVYKILRNKDIK